MPVWNWLVGSYHPNRRSFLYCRMGVVRNKDVQAFRVNTFCSGRMLYKNHSNTIAMKVFLVSIFCVMLLLSCDSEYPEAVTAKADPMEFEILNDRSQPIYYSIVETERSHLMDFADPCRRDIPPNLPAKSTLTIPYTEIQGFNKNAESVLFFWTDCQGSSNSETISLY